MAKIPDTRILMLDSITDVKPTDTGKVAVSGSHGGYFAAAVASRSGLRAVAFNDAGRGLDDAGIVGVRLLDQVGMAGVAVSAASAEIGSAEATLYCGVVSFANLTAQALGVVSGQLLEQQLEQLAGAPTPKGMMDPVEEARWEECHDGLHILCVDSASLIRPEDIGRIIITGSHGGLIGGDPGRACKTNAKLVVFNDAGGGKNGTGFSRLPALDQRRIAAVTLDCQSCRIGNAQSALETGKVSAVNKTAGVFGIKTGILLADMLSTARLNSVSNT